MSTLKVNKIEATGTTDGGIEIDSDGHIQLDGVQLPTAGSLSNRNLIINGAMQVAQRSTSAVNNPSGTSNPQYHTLDRWSSWASNADKFSSQQVADGPPGFNYSIKITSLTALSLGGGSYFALGQRIEAGNLFSTDIGTSDAKDLILSFWIKSSVAGTYSVYAFNDDWQWSFTQNYTITNANTWEYKTISIPGATSADFNVSANANQLEVGFSFGAGSNWSTSTLGSWQQGSFKIHSSTADELLTTNGATMNITGVQLEVGDKATPFEHRSFGDELARCQRYFSRSYEYGTATQTQTANGAIVSTAYSTIAYASAGTAVFPVEMRTDPDVTVYSTATGNSGEVAADNTDGTGQAAFINSRHCFLSRNNDSTGVVANAYMRAHYVADAEL